jgi:bifunctional DNA-binding transcriptional regulator/antitoxin component of YhaV-PrlF toxin-antitoxin module
MAALQQGSEVRRVQRLGGSSLVITIPKHWARRMSIKPGDEVAIIDEGDALKIAPLELVARDERVLKVRLNSVIEKIGYKNIAACAYSLGYAGLSLEWNVKSIKVDQARVASELEEAPFVDYVEARPGRIIAMFKASEGNATLDLRMLGFMISRILEGEDPLSKGFEAFIARILRGYNACQASGSLLMLYPLVEIISKIGDKVPRQVKEKLAQAIGEYTGGATVGSVKRLAKALEIASELESIGREGEAREYALVESAAVILKSMALGSICFILASRE